MRVRVTITPGRGQTTKSQLVKALQLILGKQVGTDKNGDPIYVHGLDRLTFGIDREGTLSIEGTISDDSGRTNRRKRDTVPKNNTSPRKAKRRKIGKRRKKTR